MEKAQLFSYNSEEYSSSEDSVKGFVESFSISELEKQTVYWLNFDSVADREEMEIFFDKHKFHRLTLEDVYTEHHRPKLEEFEQYLFFSIQSVLPSIEGADLNFEQISFILGKNYLISFQEREHDPFDDVRRRIREKVGKIREKDADFLLFRLLDAVIDNYFDVLEEIINVNRELENRILRDSSTNLLSRIEIQKRRLGELRNISVPIRDIAVQLEKTQNELIQSANSPYFADLKDSCLSIMDDIDSQRQILEGLSNIYFAFQGQRMNEIMKFLTVVSTIFIPLSFFAGVYGMNFRNMPELKWTYGYPLVLGGMMLAAIAMLIYFARKGWLKR